MIMFEKSIGKKEIKTLTAKVLEYCDHVVKIWRTNDRTTLTCNGHAEKLSLLDNGDFIAMPKKAKTKKLLPVGFYQWAKVQLACTRTRKHCASSRFLTVEEIMAQRPVATQEEVERFLRA